MAWTLGPEAFTERFEGTVELAYYTVEVMLCRAVYPKPHRRRFSTSSFLDRAVDITSRVSTLVETLPLSRANVFW